MFNIFRKAATEIETFVENWKRIDSLVAIHAVKRSENDEIKLLTEIEEKLKELANTIIANDTPYGNEEPLNYFVKERIFSKIVQIGTQDKPRGVMFKVLVFVNSLLSRVKNKTFLTSVTTIESIVTLVTIINQHVSEDELPSSYIPEIMKMTFSVSSLFKENPVLFNNFKVKKREFYSMVDENLLVKVILKLLQTDFQVSDKSAVKLNRRALIILLSFMDKSENSYLEGQSQLTEFLVEKLVAHFELCPSVVVIDEGAVSLDMAFNIKSNFPILLTSFFELVDYFSFLEKAISLITSNSLIERFKVSFFNNFLIEYIQDNLLSPDLNRVRTTYQYLNLLITNSKNQHVPELIFCFLFGHDASSFEYKFDPIDFSVKELEKEIHQTTGSQTKVKEEMTGAIVEDTNDIIKDDYNFSGHKNVRISLSFYKHLSSPKSYINLVLLSIVNNLATSVPILINNRLILPFAEMVLKNSQVKE